MSLEVSLPVLCTGAFSSSVGLCKLAGWCKALDGLHGHEMCPQLLHDMKPLTTKVCNMTAGWPVSLGQCHLASFPFACWRLCICV